MARKKKATPGIRKDLGGLQVTPPDRKNIERIARMEPDALKEYLAHPKHGIDERTRKLILDRHIELRSGNRPTVKRGSVTGKIQSRTAAPEQDPNVPVRKPRKLRTTAAGFDTKISVKRKTDRIARPEGRVLPEGIRPAKNSELKKGVVAVSTETKPKRKRKKAAPSLPKVGQAAKLKGEVVRVTPDNLEDVTKEKLTTVLPASGREEMTPVGRPVAEPAVLPSRLRGSRNKKNLGGFGGKVKDVQSSVYRALGHLEAMANSPKGSPEHHAAHEGYNLEHALIGQIGNKALHNNMALARTGVMEHHGTDHVHTVLKVARSAILGRLEEGKIAAQQRAERAKGQ